MKNTNRNQSKIIVCVFALCFMLTGLTAQTLIQKSYKGQLQDQGKKLVQLNDGNYIIGGNTTSFSTPNGSILLLHTTSTGDTVWSKTYKTAGVSTYFGDIIKLADGNLLLTGYTTSGSGFTKSYLAKLNTLGNIVWTKDLVIGGNIESRCVQQTTDGGYIIGTNTDGAGAGSFDMCLIKTDALGNITWSETYGTGSVEYTYYVQQTQDGGYIVGGSSQGFGNSYNEQAFIVKTTANGTMQWYKACGNLYHEEISHIKQVAGGYLVIGQSNTYSSLPGGYNFDAFIFKINTTGQTLWCKGYGNTQRDDFKDFDITPTGDLVLIGNMYIAGQGGRGYVVKTDSLGTLIWSKMYSGNYMGGFGSMLRTGNSGYILAGDSRDSTQNDNDFFLVSIDSLGKSTCLYTNAVTNVYNITMSEPAPLTAIDTANAGITAANYTLTVGSAQPEIEEVCQNAPCGIVAQFACPQQACIINPVSFVSTNSATTYSWKMDNTIFSTNDTATYQFNSSGSYEVWLVVSNPFCSDSANCIVTVNPLPTPPVITQVGSTLQSNQPTGNAWYLAGNGSVLGTNNTYAPVTDGYYYVFYTDSNGCTAMSDSVYFSLNGIVGNAYAALTKVYPNPATNNITVETVLTTAGSVATTLFNAMGQVVYSATEKTQAGIYKKNIPVNLPLGMYCISLQTQQGRTTKKIQIVN